MPKIDEIRNVVFLTKASIIGLSETKIDESILDSEIDIEMGTNCFDQRETDTVRGVICYISSNICIDVKTPPNTNIENIVFDILLPKTKAFTVSIIYRPPKQIKKFSSTYNDVNHNTNDKEIYIIGDMNIIKKLSPDNNSLSNICKQY